MGFIRLAALAGIGGVTLLGLAGLLGNVGLPPNLDAPGDVLAAHYTEHDQTTLLSGYANALAALLVLVFAAGLLAFVRTGQAEPDSDWSVVGLLGAVGLATVILVVTAVQLALPLAARESGGEPGAVRGLLALWNAGVGLIGAAAAPFLVGFGLAGRRGGVFPRWLAWLGFTGAAAGVVGAYPADVFLLVGLLQYPALFVWLLAASVRMLRAGEKVVPAAVS